MKSLTINLSDKEHAELAKLADKLSLSIEKVVILAARHYQSTAFEIEDIPKLETCPHAAPHLYCSKCKVTPCPLGLDY